MPIKKNKKAELLYEIPEDSFAYRLKSIIPEEKILPFANLVGIGEASIRQYLKGSLPSVDKVVQIARVAQVSFEWLATGEGSKDQGQQLEPKDTKLIPFIDAAASAGNGLFYAGDVAQDLRIPMASAWFHKRHLDPKELFLMPVDGDSMEPTFSDDDILVCSKAPHHIKLSDGVYVFRHDGMLKVKRLQMVKRNTIKVVSDNHLYSPYDIDQIDTDGGTDFAVIGRVVFVLCKRV